MLLFLAQAAESASSLLSGWDSLLSGWDTSTATGGAAAAILGAVWVLFKVIRAVVGTLFMLCVVFLVLKVCCDIDISAWLGALAEQLNLSPAA